MPIIPIPPVRRRTATPFSARLHERAATVIAPAAVAATRDHVRIDGDYTATLALTGYPRQLIWGLVDRLAALGEPLMVSVHLAPQDHAHVGRVYAERLTALESSRLLAADHQRLPSPNRAQAIADITAMLERAERGDDRLFAAGVYVRVRGATPDEVERRLRRVEGACGQAKVLTRRALFEQAAGLEATLPVGRDALGATAPLEGRAVAALDLFGDAGLCMPDGVWYGRHTRRHTPVVSDPFDEGFTSFGGVTLGAMGAGKSATSKVEILRSRALGVHRLVIDPGESGEYVRLAQEIGGQVVRLSAGSADRINPLDLPRLSAAARADDAEYDLLGEHVAGVTQLLETLLTGHGEHLTTHEQGRLEAALFACYKAAGITRDPATHGHAAPAFPDLHATLAASGDAYGLAERLQRYTEGSLRGLFAGRTTIRLDDPFTVFDLRGIDNDTLLAGTMHLLAQVVWGAVLGERRRRVLDIDEAHRVTRKERSGAFVAKVGKQGRKHLFGVNALTQDPEDLLKTESGRALLLNGARTFIFRCEELALDALGAHLALSATERRHIQAAPPGTCLLLCKDPYAPGRVKRIPLEMMVSPELAPLVFTNPHGGGWLERRAAAPSREGAS